MSSSKREAKPTADVLSLAVRYTRARVRSVHEVSSYLQRRGVSRETATRVVTACQARGLVDDRACACLWADHWARRGYAWAAIRLKLSAKGLEDEAIDHAANGLEGASDDAARARLVAETYLSRRHVSPDRRARRLSRSMAPHVAGGLARTLAARGFDADLIERILNESLRIHFAARNVSDES